MRFDIPIYDLEEPNPMYEEISSLVEDKKYGIDLEEIDDKGKRLIIQLSRYKTILYVAEYLVDNVS
ncbi:hypothetical protein [Candidatus Azobacteroides pseudotrichonymphae]|uniref:hypothetical protein n=1 Tax=Candidatus Azobacteroides pseudotrichonymphae TaxID=511435 RepID=UPI00223C627E|nr:hypothetical protein [Candidatus Azobacteroides pseudotrichonymphae]